MSSAARAAGAPVAVSGTGVVSPLGNDRAAFDDAIFAGRSAVRAHPIDLPGIDLSAVPVAAADFDAASVHPGAVLDQLGLDSLALMEFVFAAEDRFDVRIPEERLDPRQAGVTLERLADLLDEAIAAKAKPHVVSS